MDAAQGTELEPRLRIRVVTASYFVSLLSGETSAVRAQEL
jgi:hypothetical protein